MSYLMMIMGQSKERRRKRKEDESLNPRLPFAVTEVCNANAIAGLSLSRSLSMQIVHSPAKARWPSLRCELLTGLLFVISILLNPLSSLVVASLELAVAATAGAAA